MDVLVGDPAPIDAVLVQRARATKWTKAAKRLGYGALMIAVIAFGVAAATGYPPVAAAIVLGGLIASCILLPPALIAGYGLAAAAKEDSESLDARPGAPSV